MLFKPKHAGWVAVCLYPDRVDVARVGFSSARPKLELLESYERGADDVDTLKRLSRKHDLARRNVTTLLAPGDYQLLSVDAPKVARAEMKDAVRWQIKDMLDYPVEQATIDLLEIPASQSSANRVPAVLVAAARNSAIEPLMKAFSGAHVGLKAIDVCELGQRNVAALYEEENRGLAMLSFDTAAGYLTFTCNGELYMSRRVDVGLNQLLNADGERQTQLLEKIGLELQRSIDNVERQFSAIPLKKLLLAPHPQADQLRMFLSDYINVQIEILDLSAVIDFSAVPALASSERQTQCFATLGAALRSEVAA